MCWHVLNLPRPAWRCVRALLDLSRAEAQTATAGHQYFVNALATTVPA